jgi:aldehyde dehydrogenase (NAD+)
MQKFQNYIGGSWLDPLSGGYIENRNPANINDLIGAFPRSGAEDVASAVRAASEAFNAWRLVPAPHRGDIIRRAGDILTVRKNELAAVMTREMGKPIAETLGDVQEGIDTAYYCATEGRRLFGINTPSELPDKLNLSFRVPIGVCGLITPWNFPMAIPTWNLFPGLVAGNTFVFKPAEDTPHTALLLTEILIEAGLPKGVLNLVMGDGSTGAYIVEHPDVRAVSFTGSTATGSVVARTCGAQTKHVCLEMGGKNAQIVMDDANLDLAIEGVLWGAFGTTGQRCTATSRLILHERIHDEFLSRLQDRVAALIVGDGADPKTNVGPLINEKQLKRIENYVRIGIEEGAVLLLGGKKLTGGQFDGGYFFEPTVFTGVTSAHTIAREEIFGPVLSVIRTTGLDDAIRTVNSVSYGLSASIYTANINSALHAARDIETGIFYINAPTIGAEAHMPFGGVKATGNGHREGGWTVFDFYTEWKVVYIDYSGRLQRAQIDTD